MKRCPNRSVVTWQLQYQPGESSGRPIYLPRLSRARPILKSLLAVDPYWANIGNILVNI